MCSITCRLYFASSFLKAIIYCLISIILIWSILLSKVANVCCSLGQWIAEQCWKRSYDEKVKDCAPSGTDARRIFVIYWTSALNIIKRYSWISINKSMLNFLSSGNKIFLVLIHFFFKTKLFARLFFKHNLLLFICLLCYFLQ